MIGLRLLLTHFHTIAIMESVPSLSNVWLYMPQRASVLRLIQLAVSRPYALKHTLNLSL
jgi:hypothetical protein